MAGIIAVTAVDTEEALAADTAETLLQLVAATNHRVRVLEWGVFFDGEVVTSAPVRVTLTTQTGAGTSAAGTVDKWNTSDNETLQTTSRITFTVEPTTDDETLAALEVHPQGGYEKVYPLGQEFLLNGGERVGIKCLAPGVGVNARAYFKFEE